MTLYDLVKYYVHSDIKAPDGYEGHIDGEGYRDQFDLVASFYNLNDAKSFMNFMNRTKHMYSWYEIHAKVDGKYTGERYS
ncbi:MAG: hypothetical protein PHS04_18420 [Tissierellia bacterium]|jgi:hypothetical protein|nr:hypothetical protein [Tissierellia bacterium]